MDYIEELKKDSGVEVDSIVTFDKWGISSHPNHIAVHMACKNLYDSGDFKGDMYTLETVNMFRKYIAFGDIFYSRIGQVNFYLDKPWLAG